VKCNAGYGGYWGGGAGRAALVGWLWDGNSGGVRRVEKVKGGGGGNELSGFYGDAASMFHWSEGVEKCG